VSGAAGDAPPSLPGYTYLEHLGSGGYSQVYLYEQDMPRRRVAVKVLNRAGLTEATRRQFTAEANAMAGLADHPNIVQVFQAEVTGDGRPYLVMQYYPQPNLSVRARREQFSVAEVLRIGIQIGSAVETAHRNGILHRDIKPHNILTGQFGTPALTDFGIAATKGAEDGGPEGMSVPWSPPEILYGTTDGDERSDVYSLAATLWHLLVGRSPFEEPGGDNSTVALMRRILTDPPRPTQRADVPDSLERLLRQAMAKDPAARPPMALDFVRGLQAVEQAERLPLTQIMLATDGPPAHGPPAPGGPAADEDEATRVRGARRIDPQPPIAPPAAPAPGRARVFPDTADTRVRGAVRPRPQPLPPGPPPPGRPRQMPAGPRHESTTVRRPVAPAPRAPEPAEPEAPAPRRPGRIIGIAAGCVLVVAAVGAVLLLGHHGGGHTPGGTGSSAGDTQSALGPGATAPGTPTVTVARAGARKLRFRWTYANHAAGDTFRWHRVSGGTGPAAGSITRPTLLLAAPHRRSVCVTVQVVRANGQASDTSMPKCWP
jgi:hypothetical protein